MCNLIILYVAEETMWVLLSQHRLAAFTNCNLADLLQTIVIIDQKVALCVPKLQILAERNEGLRGLAAKHTQFRFKFSRHRLADCQD